MGQSDRLVRFVLGWALIFLGVVYTDVIDDPKLNSILAFFGVMNVVSSTFKVCPAYLLARISTIRRSDRPVAVESVDKPITEAFDGDIDSNESLRRKLQFSVVLPMLALLAVFGGIAYDLNHRFEMSVVTKEIDVATQLAAKRRQLLVAQSSEESYDGVIEFSTNDIIGEISTQVELFVLHDQAGRVLPSSVARGTDNETLQQDWAAKASKALQQDTRSAHGMLMSQGVDYIWSSQRVGESGEWFTAIMRSPDDHQLLSYLLSPGFLVLISVVMWLGIWSSTYIVRTFVEKMDNNARLLQHRTMHDALTGLPNRQKMESIIDSRMKTLNKEAESVVLVMVDIIDFRVINETLGYALGDQLLVQIGNSLQQIEPERTDVVRMGGDIFCLVAITAHDRIHASRLANEVHDTLERVHELDGIPIGIQVRTGLSIGPMDSVCPEDLVRFADIAMAQAKKQRTKDCFYQHDQDSHSIRKLALLSRLRTAIEDNELSLVYQPKVNIATQTLAGVEVLVRWTDAEYGPVSPIEFVTWAEKSGLIDKLTHWVLTNAERQCREWRDRGHHIPFAVNLSPTNLYDNKLIPLISKLVKEGSFGGGMLELEITENALMEDPERAVRAMRVLDALGVNFAIDDFGTGLSSFSYLRTMPVSNLKIDRAFIIDTDKSDKDAVLLRSMIKLGHGLGCVVTAEGVEDEDTMERLRQYHCDHVQGYHVCRPVPADEFLRWMQDSEWRANKQAA